MTINDPDSNHSGVDDPFVKRLRAQRTAELPAHWRADILAAVQLAANPSPTAAPHRQRTTGIFRAWLWPHPGAYAALSAAWLVILVLRLATPSPAPSIISQNAAPLAAQMDYPRTLAREQLAINTVLSASLRQREARP